MTVFDASALLTYLLHERGTDEVAARLQGGGHVGAANWWETAQKVIGAGADWGLARGLLLSFDLQIEPVTAADAEDAAAMWSPRTGLSLGDRLCLALGRRLGREILTADRAWQGWDNVVLVR